MVKFSVYLNRHVFVMSLQLVFGFQIACVNFCIHLLSYTQTVCVGGFLYPILGFSMVTDHLYVEDGNTSKILFQLSFTCILQYIPVVFF